ncbi:MAG: N-acetylneuraminate synthase [Dehalococcoidaceae bacterium]|nr:N-acetylneuraminate synthase [Dehalococcoidaceae bacterium]|tara:strand:+ start:1257 stop:2306 length:1050 start_codon:yes stop_codon:yes gene_type:complete
MNSIKIGQYKISLNSEPFLIAEAGINHNGDIDKVMKMIHIAKESGVNAVKFFTYKTSEFILDKNLTHTYISQKQEIVESMYDMFRRCEFSKQDWKKIKDKCDDEEILFLSTPENRTDLDLLLELDIQAIKIGSDDLINIPLIKEFSSTQLPIIMSCGMSTLNEIKESLQIFNFEKDYPIVLMLTTSEYPTQAENVNLLKLKTLSNTFPNIILGFSDHTQNSLAASIAVGLGAKVFEKHFTISHDLPGPDHWFSADSVELKKWVKNIKQAHQMLGSEIVEPTKKENMVKFQARRSIISKKNISIGEIFSEENLGLFRPGNGLPPKKIFDVLGKKAKKEISKGKLINEEDY